MTFLPKIVEPCCDFTRTEILVRMNANYFIRTHYFSVLAVLCLIATLWIISPWLTKQQHEDSRAPSIQPPHNLSPQNVPLFVVFGFDDNLTASGIDWANSLFQHKYNQGSIKPDAAKNQSPTFDATPARASFYMNTRGFNEFVKGPPAPLINRVKQLHHFGHEIGNHTHNHHYDLYDKNLSHFQKRIHGISQKDWEQRIQQCNLTLKQHHITDNIITGFRAPYLQYNQALFTALNNNHFIYDASITEGIAKKFNGKNLRWPYTLENGSPGHNEGWTNHPDNPLAVTLNDLPALWELPVYVLMIPTDDLANDYHFQEGLWQRMQKSLPYLTNHRITGIDYNLWVNAKLQAKEVLAILKYNLDLRLAGNRAPLTFGLHSQYYTDKEWQKSYAPQTSLPNMQQAIRDFVDYALSKKDVRVRPGKDVIAWCKNPIPFYEKH